MKYTGRITLLFISIATSLAFLIKGDVWSLFYIVFSTLHACLSWFLGGCYDKYRFLSLHDPLTGVYNRRYAYKVFEKKFHRSMDRNEKLGIINIDVDHFKTINDTYGHAYGDFVLKELSRGIQKSIGKKGILVRWGGDEFLVLLQNEDRTDVNLLIERIHRTVQKDSCSKDEMPDITLSIGFSLYPDDDAETLNELIAIADKRMYRDKAKSDISERHFFSK